MNIYFRALTTLLNCLSESEKEAFRPHLEQVQQTLAEFISITPFEASRDALLSHYEALQCSRTIVTLYPEEGLDRYVFLAKLKFHVKRLTK